MQAIFLSLTATLGRKTIRLSVARSPDGHALHQAAGVW
jgi:hypothetical protein